MPRTFPRCSPDETLNAVYIDNLVSPHCCIDRVGDFGVVLCIARLNAGKKENDWILFGLFFGVIIIAAVKVLAGSSRKSDKEDVLELAVESLCHKFFFGIWVIGVLVNEKIILDHHHEK